MKNKLLAATEQKIESGLWGRTRQDYEKVVTAGMQAALKGGPNSIIASLQHSKNVIHDCAVGALHLALILRKQSRNTMPLQAMIPGATVLMLHALDFAEEMGLIHVSEPELKQATHFLVNTLFQRLHVTPQMLQTAAGKVHALSQNPVSMERMKMVAGMTKHPDAAEPTPMPAAEGEPHDESDEDEEAE